MYEESIDQLCQRALLGRGYIVVSSSAEIPLGSVHSETTGNHSSVGDLKHPVVIIAATDKQDSLDQAEWLGCDYHPIAGHAYYYRAIAE